MTDKFIGKPSPQDVRSARIASGMTQSQAAKRFSYALVSWQQKEAEGKTNRSLSSGEYELLLLLADSHPDYELKTR
ncbi:hypothetical protein GPY51_21360 [Photorhabdus laumondii subsp. laumondii]|nr:hypothetical protein [Photorhabdus laumondii]AWK42610.1 hypothetical protein A4R40_14480 [Photorhabdus laumondii subsp. laumondii]AXG47935.1 hypothetical protein PluTT01m_14900 [Photorhabdus laumondii subsp. laumondii]MCC8384952.1 hypothetical protein [Photorhabdus laumondii]MCC8413658.1 hypothetical protein [Photorhabdus laumondii]NDK96820.1 hypothetical protein [Photorhabdus laumondii subsp. laumondii]